MKILETRLEPYQYIDLLLFWDTLNWWLSLAKDCIEAYQTLDLYTNDGKLLWQQEMVFCWCGTFPPLRMMKRALSKSRKLEMEAVFGPCDLPLVSKSFWESVDWVRIHRVRPHSCFRWSFWLSLPLTATALYLNDCNFYFVFAIYK